MNAGQHAFNHQVGWADPGPETVPARHHAFDVMNAARVQWGLPRLPTNRSLTETLRDHGIMTCEGTPYVRMVPAEAAEEATA